MRATKNVIDIVLLVLVALFLVFACESLIESIIRGMPAFVGIIPVEVMSPSMESSNYHVGSIYFISCWGNSSVGDVVAFNHGGEIWLHEIVSAGNDFFQTKGSSNILQDSFTITTSDIIGRCIGGGMTMQEFQAIKLALLSVLYIFAMNELSIQLIKELQNALILEQFPRRTTHQEIIVQQRKHINRAVAKKAVLCFIVVLSAFSFTSDVYCSTTQSIVSSTDISYIAPVADSTIIENLDTLSKDEKSSLYEYFSSRRVCSTMDSNGTNWAPKVKAELAKMMGCDESDLANTTWVIQKTSNGYDIYYTDESLSSLSYGDTISRVYKYSQSTLVKSYSTATVKYGISGFDIFKTINTSSYDTANEKII